MVLEALGLSDRSADVRLQKIAKNTLSIVPIDTPFYGSKLRPWGRAGIKNTNLLQSNNPFIVGVLLPRSEILADICHDFGRLIRRRRETQPI